jgi:maleylpyruvate isomerase
MPTTYRLHNYWRSSASWRVRIAFALKGVAYEYVAVNIVKDGGEQHREAYGVLNPLRQVPALELVEGGFSRFLAQSLPIIEYLDETVHAGPRLLPVDPFLRARVRQVAEGINAGIQPLQNLPVFAEIERLGGDKLVWAKKWNERGLLALEALARDTAGTFLVGETPTLADACLVPQMYSARRFGVDTAPYVTLERVENACLAIAAIDATRPEKQPDAVVPA